MAAAMLANLSVAARLGCTLVVAGADASSDPGPWPGGTGRAAPVCVSTEGPAGQDCTTCTDEDGARTACGPVDCQSTTRQDGAVCTSCTDADGRSSTTCPGDEWPSDCDSVLQDFGLLCSTCPGGSDSVPECLVASCTVSNRCLECTDPKGRVGIDCSIDYEVLPTASVGIGGGDTFDSCGVSYGYPGGASGVCHYPGPHTCDVSRETACIDCIYPDGSGTGLCLGDPSEALPAVMAGRPSSLPAPGACITETSQSGLVECSTCTRYDLSAAKMCRFPPARRCDTTGRGNPMEHCIGCSLAQGGTALLCDDAGL